MRQSPSDGGNCWSLGGAVAWPLAAGAQQTERVWRIGVVNLTKFQG